MIQDITADGWILNKLPEKLTYAGPIQSLGTKIGILMGFSIYSIIEKAIPWFSFNHWIIGVVTTLVLTNIVILICVSEGDEAKDFTTLNVVKIVLKKVIRLRHIRQLALTLLVLCLATATTFHGKLFYIQLQEQNFTRGQVGQIELYLAPL